MDSNFSREMLTRVLSEEDLRAEIDYFVSYWTSHGHLSAPVLFGYEWGIRYYPDKHWETEIVQLANLTEKIAELERSNLGKISHDDLFIDIDDQRFQFCHDSDLHLHFEKANEHTEHFWTRWGEIGYQPSEWTAQQERELRTLIRRYDSNAGS